MIVIENNQKEENFFYILRWLNDVVDLIKIKNFPKNEILQLLEISFTMAAGDPGSEDLPAAS